MILKDKGIPDSTMLSLVAKLLKRDTTTKGFKVKGVDGVQPVTYKEVVDFVETLREMVQHGDYCEIHKCIDCGNFNASAHSRGACFPKDFTCSRANGDYCSKWIPMDESQKQFRRKMNELQTQRAGNGSKDSHESNRPTAGAKAKRRSDSK